MDTPKVPFAINNVIHNLYQATDALKRRSIQEAQRYIHESLADAKNESEWTLHTDTDLPAMINYLESLDNCLTTVRITCNLDLLPTIIEEIQGLNKSLEHIVAGKVHWQEPDRIDDLEKNYRRSRHATKT
jgi:hypothetical protein